MIKSQDLSNASISKATTLPRKSLRLVHNPSYQQRCANPFAWYTSKSIQPKPKIPYLHTMNYAHAIFTSMNILFGKAIGDALGVPVEFSSRKSLQKNPVTSLRAFGTHSQEAGTWSDDTSLALCTASSIANGFDINDLASRFIRWYRQAYWSAKGEVFDIGITTAKAISRLEEGIDPEKAGGSSENDNGNGSLMRIAPMVLYVTHLPQPERFRIIQQVSSLTHAHIRSVVACIYLVEFLRLMDNNTFPENTYELLAKLLPPRLIEFGVPEEELQHFDNFFRHDIRRLSEDQIQSSGYVIHTLEASVWCLLTSLSYQEAVLKAVNLGGDTDTTAAVTGALAGLFWGIETMPEEWRLNIARHDDIINLCIQLRDKLGQDTSS